MLSPLRPGRRPRYRGLNAKSKKHTLERGCGCGFRIAPTHTPHRWRPQTPNPKPQTPHPKPHTPHPKPQTPNPNPQTPHPTPMAAPHPKPHTDGGP
ncbi:MAG: hypothetical protein F6J93_40405, partial [Oscillatoria sp. SIO1A7]|nr:hypothetical protein [Oscillatoria sp. SIO1A7]